MVVQHVWTPRVSAELTGVGYEPEGEVLVAGRPAEADELEPLRELLTVTALCNDATLRPADDRTLDDRWTALGDPMEAALLTAAAKTGCPEPSELAVTRPRIGEVPFDSVRRRMTTLHKTGGDEVLVCMKGAPEAVIDPAVLLDSPESLAAARQEAARLAARGYRVLAVASGVRNDLPSPVTEAESGLALLGLAALSDPPKPHAAATLASCDGRSADHPFFKSLPSTVRSSQDVADASAGHRWESDDGGGADGVGQAVLRDLSQR